MSPLGFAWRFKFRGLGALLKGLLVWRSTSIEW